MTAQGQVRTVGKNTTISLLNTILCVLSAGRRKTSVAVVHLKQGEGQIVVNSEPLLSYFPLVEQRQQVLFPLVATEMLGSVEVSALVRGGGKTGTEAHLVHMVHMVTSHLYTECRSGWGHQVGH